MNDEEININNLINKYLSVIYNIKNKNRDIDMIILGMESLNHLRYNLQSYEWETKNNSDSLNSGFLFGYPIKILDFLPKEYIGIKLK